MVSTLSTIAPNGQIPEFTGSRLDLSSPNFIARLFYLNKMEKNDNVVQQKHKHVMFREKIFEKLHASHQRWKKQMFRHNPLKIN